MLDIDGREVHLTNLDKIFWPDAGWRKADLISYYIGISPHILPHLRRRPLVMVRYPDGISGESWFHKDLPAGAPEWVQTIRVWHHAEKKEVHYVVCDDLPTLTWLAQMGTIEIHTWTACIDDVKKADLAVFDIDPQTGEFADAVDGARMVCDLLDELDLKYYLKTTGKRGIHVFSPLRPDGPHSEVRDVVHEAVLLLERRHPDTFALSYVKSKRQGRLFIDYAQNSFGKTNITPYSLRATRDATVSTPIRRSELTRTDPHAFRLDNIGRRLSRTGDLWEHLGRSGEVTIAEARRRLRALPD